MIETWPYNKLTIILLLKNQNLILILMKLKE